MSKRTNRRERSHNLDCKKRLRMHAQAQKRTAKLAEACAGSTDPRSSRACKRWKKAQAKTQQLLYATRKVCFGSYAKKLYR